MRAATMVRAVVAAALVALVGEAAGHGASAATTAPGRVPARSTAAPASTVAPSRTLPTTAPSPGGGAGTTPRLRLTAQTSELAGDGVFRVAVAVDGITGSDPGSLEVAATLYRRVTSRRDLRAAFDGSGLDSVLAVAARPLPAELVPGVNTDSAGRALLWVDLPIGSCEGCTTLGARGVYPVRLVLREARGGRVLASFVTALLRSAEAGSPRLQVAMVVPFHRSPAEQHGGALSTLASPLAMVTDRLAAHPSVRLTLLPTPETVDTLARDGEGGDPQLIARLRTALGEREILGGPYVRVADKYLGDPAYANEVDEQLAAGRDALVDTLRIEPLDGVFVVRDGVALPGRSSLERLGVQRLLVPESALAPSSGGPVYDQPVTYDPGASEGVTTPAIPAMVLDPVLAAHLEPSAGRNTSSTGTRSAADDDPVLRSHHLLADLVMIQQEAPRRPRGVAVVIPVAAMTNASLDALFGGVETSSFLQSATMSDLFSLPAATGQGGTVHIRKADTVDTPTFTVEDTQFAATLREARERVEGYIGLFDRVPPLAASLRHDLLLSLADGLPSDTEPAVLVARTRKRVDAELGRVSVRPHQSYRLLDRRAKIPVTISNGFGVPVKVRATLASDRIEFPSDDRPAQRSTTARTASITRSLLLESQSTTERFVVSTRSSGRFPLVVIVSTPNGVVLSRARYTVRSTAASGVGVVLTIGALAFLAIWWGRHILRSRRLRARPRHPAATTGV